MQTYAQIKESINTHNRPEVHHTIGLMGGTQDNKNRTHVYANPAYSPDHTGTPFAYIETEYTYRGDEWSASAYAVVESPRWFEKTEHSPRINFDLQNVYNLTRRADYGFMNPRANMTKPQVLAAKTALSLITGTTPPKDEYTGTPMKISKRDVLQMIETAARDELTSHPVNYHNGPDKADNYASDYRRTAATAADYKIWGNRYDQARTAYGHTITEDDLTRITARLVKAHKAELTARARAL